MDFTKGTRTKTVEDAEEFIRSFIVELRNDESGRMHRHSRDYDLFLPWLWEELVNSGTHLEPAHLEMEASRLYMEAAWSLVMKGYLRPGPVKISAGVAGGDLGKGYSVTYSGETWLIAADETAALDGIPE